MSGVTTANGGDGWSSWTVKRHGNNMQIIVFSDAEKERAETPSGWQKKVIHE